MAADLRLVEAAKTGDKVAVRALLKQHVDVYTSVADGATALSWASYRDDLETADLLIAAGANVNAANDYGATPLMLACVNGSAGMVDKLLKSGANPNSSVLTGARQPGETVLMRCAHTGNVETVKLLLAAEADVNAKENRQGDTALMWAVAQRHDDIARVLIAHKADVRARTSDGFTALMFAAQQGDADSAQMLLDAGADVNDVTPDGDSALLVASSSGHEAFSIYLLEHGANPNAVERNGTTALHYAIMDGLGQLGGGSAYHADEPYRHRPDMVALVKALLAHGANPNARLLTPTVERPQYARILRINNPNTGGGRIKPAGATPLMLAALSIDPDLMRILLAAGADPRLMTTDSVTLLMVALGLGREKARSASSIRRSSSPEIMEMVKMLVDLGADVNAVETDTGLTPLHCAAFYGGSERIIQYLVEKGAKLDPKTTAGQTPLAIASAVAPKGAVERNLVPYAYWKDSVDLLLKLGATPLTASVAQPADASSGSTAWQ